MRTHSHVSIIRIYSAPKGILISAVDSSFSLLSLYLYHFFYNYPILPIKFINYWIYAGRSQKRKSIYSLLFLQCSNQGLWIQNNTEGNLFPVMLNLSCLACL